MLRSSLLFLSFVSATFAANLASGLGRLSPGELQLDIEFSAGLFSNTINEIAFSLTQGPNRTEKTGIPVERIYGVNVSTTSNPPEET